MEVCQAQANKISFWQTARDSNWVDLALVVTALVVATLGGFAHVGWGSFAAFSGSATLGSLLLGMSALLLVSIVAYKAIACTIAPPRTNPGGGE